MILAVPLLVVLFLLRLLRRQPCRLGVDPIGPLGFLRSRREARRAQAELPFPHRGLDVVAGVDARRWVLVAVIARRPMERVEIGDARGRPAEVPRRRRRGSRGVVMVMEVLDLQVTPRPRVAVQRLQAVVRGQRGHHEDGEVTRGAPSDPRHGSRPRPPRPDCDFFGTPPSETAVHRADGKSDTTRSGADGRDGGGRGEAA